MVRRADRKPAGGELRSRDATGCYKYCSRPEGNLPGNAFPYTEHIFSRCLSSRDRCFRRVLNLTRHLRVILSDVLDLPGGNCPSYADQFEEQVCEMLSPSPTMMS